MLLLYAVVLGLLIGLLIGGRPAALATARFRWWGLALFGLLFQVLLFGPPLATMVGDLGPALYVGSTGLVLIALLPNLRQPGFAILGLGALLNFAAISLNGGLMPAAPGAFEALNGVARVPAEHFSNSHLIGPTTLLPWLGDIFVLPRPFPLANVFSLGDALIGLGGTLFIVRTMRRAVPAGSSEDPHAGASDGPPQRTGKPASRPAAQHG